MSIFLVFITFFARTNIATLPLIFAYIIYCLIYYHFIPFSIVSLVLILLLNFYFNKKIYGRKK